MMNATKVVMYPTSQPKFWPEEPVTNVSGKKMATRTVSYSMAAFWRMLILDCPTGSTAMFASSTVPGSGWTAR